jgi:hypothetical protein
MRTHSPDLHRPGLDRHQADARSGGYRTPPPGRW